MSLQESIYFNSMKTKFQFAQKFCQPILYLMEVVQNKSQGDKWKSY